MKTLLLVRHAKSSWDDPGLDDRERPLNRRGLRNAPEMGRRLARRGELPQLLVSSVAERAATTARAIAAAIGFPAQHIDYREALYTFDAAAVLDCARGFGDACNAVLLVGHNPALTELANRLAAADIDNIPTCGAAKLELPLQRWAELAPGCAQLAYFDYPKNRP